MSYVFLGLDIFNSFFLFDQFVCNFFVNNITVEVFVFFFFDMISYLVCLSITEIVLFVFIFVSCWLIIVTSDFRNKFFYFIIFFMLMFMWGLWLSYDVIVIMAALIELPLIIVFLFIFLS
jgi:hypothetical protein